MVVPVSESVRVGGGIQHLQRVARADLVNTGTYGPVETREQRRVLDDDPVLCTAGGGLYGVGNAEEAFAVVPLDVFLRGDHLLLSVHVLPGPAVALEVLAVLSCLGAVARGIKDKVLINGSHLGCDFGRGGVTIGVSVCDGAKGRDPAVLSPPLSAGRFLRIS